MVLTLAPKAAQDLEALCRDILGRQRLILASNRAPVEFHRDNNGNLEVRRGSGGVVTALSSIARFANLSWLSSPMTAADHEMARRPFVTVDDPWGQATGDLRLRFVSTPPSAFDKYYNLISNPVLWFLQHSLWSELQRPGLWALIRDGWQSGYLTVNGAFARAVLAELRMPDAAPYVMFHDYHLYTAPLYVRAEAPHVTLTHFIHVPWPAPEAWQQLPWGMAETICCGLLANDIVGFQTKLSARNFLLTCQSFIRDARVDFDGWAIHHRGRTTRARVYPISVDIADLRQRLGSPRVQYYKDRLSALTGTYTIVRVDRLDPSKNIIAGFQAFELLLNRYPQLLGQVKFLAFLVPSRTAIPEYRRYTDRVFALAREINQRYERLGWRPVEIFYEHNYEQALAAMSLYDVLLVNSVADGMNLVSKEGPVVNQQDGVLVLSRNAGSFEELGEVALSVCPRDIAGTAEALARALFMSADEKRRRAQRLRSIVEQRDLCQWLRDQLQDMQALTVAAR